MSVQEDKILTVAGGEKLYNDLMKKKASIIIDSVSGNPVTINDGIPKLRLYDMKVSFSPRQGGTGDPSPTNIRPITGWTGLKICRNNGNFLAKPDALSNEWTNTLYGVTAVYNDGYLDVTGTSDPESGNWSNVVSFNTAFSSNPILLPPGDYAMPQGMTICITQNGVSANKASPFTLTENANLVGFYVAVYKGTQANLHIPLTVVAGTERPTEYIEQEASVYPVSWQTEAETACEGTLDVLTGLLTITRVLWKKNTSEMNNGESYPGWRDCGIRNLIGEGINQSFLNQISNVGKAYSANTNGDNDILFLSYGQYGKTESEWKALALDVQIAVELVTPQTIQLTPNQIALLTGVNTIWTDADSIDIAYPVDTKKYIDAGSSDVKDVRVNGTSIINGGIANIPYASQSEYGLVKRGKGLFIDPSTGALVVDFGDSSQIKQGTNTNAVMSIFKQHESVFYGLAKASGADLANETVTLGQYPGNAKSAIQTMIGVESGVSFIDTVSGSTPTINGVPNVKYKCDEVSTITINAPANGTIDVWFISGSTPTLLTTTGVIFPEWFIPEELESNMVYEMVITDGYAEVATWVRPITV